MSSEEMSDKVEKWLRDKLKDPWSASGLVPVCSEGMLEGIKVHLHNIDALVVVRLLMAWLHLRGRQTIELSSVFEEIIDVCLTIEKRDVSQTKWIRETALSVQRVVKANSSESLENPFNPSEVSDILKKQPLWMLPDGFDLVDDEHVPFTPRYLSKPLFDVKSSVSIKDLQQMGSEDVQQRAVKPPSIRTITQSSRSSFGIHASRTSHTISAASSILNRTKHHLSSKKSGVKMLDPKQIAEVQMNHKRPRLAPEEVERRKQEKEEKKREKDRIKEEEKRKKEEERSMANLHPIEYQHNPMQQFLPGMQQSFYSDSQMMHYYPQQPTSLPPHMNQFQHLPPPILSQMLAIVDGANKLTDTGMQLIQRFLMGQPIESEDLKGGILKIVLSEHIIESEGQLKREIVLFELNTNQGSWRKLKKMKNTVK